jgi:hypothetical protein
VVNRAWLHSVATAPSGKRLYPNACPTLLMSYGWLCVELGKLPKLMTLPLHSMAYSTPPTTLTPTTRPTLLMPWAALSVELGRPPKLMTLPPLHSMALD